jgi:hypothetical protein
VVVTIASGTTVQMVTIDGANLGIDANRVELIVNGTLRAHGPTAFTSKSPTPMGGDWYGIRFQPGSGGWLHGVTVEYGVVGVSIDNASPTLMDNIIHTMQGDDGADGASGLLGNPGGDGSSGGPAYGIYVTGTSTSTIQNNTAYSISGGSGGDGGSGSVGFGPGASGAEGGNGGSGGAAAGIFAGNRATPQVQSNTVMTTTGGQGG